MIEKRIEKSEMYEIKIWQTHWENGSLLNHSNIELNPVSSESPAQNWSLGWLLTLYQWAWRICPLKSLSSVKWDTFSDNFISWLKLLQSCFELLWVDMEPMLGQCSCHFHICILSAIREVLWTCNHLRPWRRKMWRAPIRPDKLPTRGVKPQDVSRKVEDSISRSFNSLKCWKSVLCQLKFDWTLLMAVNLYVFFWNIKFIFSFFCFWRQMESALRRYSWRMWRCDAGRPRRWLKCLDTLRLVEGTKGTEGTEGREGRDCFATWTENCRILYKKSQECLDHIRSRLWGTRE